MTHTTRDRPSCSRSEGGFSLIEVLQTLILLAVGLLSLSSLTLGTVHGNASAARITSGAVVAQDKIEELRNTDFAAIVGGTDQIVIDRVTYQRSWSVCSDRPVTGAVEVTVTVAWLDGFEKTATLQTIIAR